MRTVHFGVIVNVRCSSDPIRDSVIRSILSNAVDIIYRLTASGGYTFHIQLLRKTYGTKHL